MTRWIRQLLRTTSTSPFFKPRRTTLGLQRLEERDTPATFTVTNLLDDGSNGSLRWAVGKANTTTGADTIAFLEALSGSTVKLGGTRLDVREAVAIVGPSQGVTIDANSKSQVFYFDGRTNGTYAASLSNITITRGNTLGGGVVIDGIDSATFGGGILNDQTNLTLTSVTVSNNQTNNDGGGLHNWPGANSKLTVNNSLFVGNSAARDSGAIHNSANSTITVANTTFSANTAGRDGGAILQDGGVILLTNVTATLNLADSDNNGSGTGGFLRISSGTVTTNNSIFSGNLRGISTPDEFAGTLVAASANNIIRDTATAGGLTNGTNGNRIGVDPLLGALLDNGGLTFSHALGKSSQAINAGSNALVSGTNDGRGAPFVRIFGGTVDIGAFEVQATPIVLVVDNSGDIDDGNYGPGQLTLREAVRLTANPGPDTISFSKSLNGSTITLTFGLLRIRDASGITTINGPGADLIRISGNNTSGIFQVNSGASASINKLTLTNGRANVGGAINNLGTVTINRVVFDSNQAYLGGAMFSSGTVTIDQALFVNNKAVGGNGANGSATGGGGGGGGGAGLGGAFANQGTGTVINTTFSGNQAIGGNGGQAFVNGGEFFGNGGEGGNKGGSGGTLGADGSNGVNFTGGGGGAGSFLAGGNGGQGGFASGGGGGGSRTAGDAGGIGGRGDSTGGGAGGGGDGGSGNSGFAAGGGGGAGIGGAIYNVNGTLTLLNNTIANNSAVKGLGGNGPTGSDNAGRVGRGLGGGIYNYAGPDGDGILVMRNTLVANNTAENGQDIRGAINTSGNNLISNTAATTGIVASDIINVNPLLLPLSNNGGTILTHALGQNSPALGKGSAAFANYVPWDQRGTARDAVTPDIGATEVQHPLATVGAPTTLAELYSPKPSTTANEAFVKGLYQSTLLRPADTAGLNGWLTLLNSGTSRTTVANGFVNSTENRQNQVTFFYRYFLMREPDTAGLNGWVSILQGGTDEGQVMTGFILSNEFSGQNNNSQFVNLMYYALLSRQADSAGFNGWLNALNGGMTRATVVNAFLRSEEGINRVVDSLFQTYLKRYAAANELSAFRTFLNSNTFGMAATVILSGPEFFTNAGNNLS